LITITRRLARRLRAVFRRALPTSPRGQAPAVTFTATRRSLEVRVQSGAATVRYLQAGHFTPSELELPHALLDACAGAGDDAVNLEPRGEQQIVARWSDSGIAQVAVYERSQQPVAAAVPKLPRKLAENSRRLVTALRDASECTDPSSSRYALGHVQLRPQRGEITATDGRQLLVQRGFVFPWYEDLLIGRSNVFGHPELVVAETVMIGYREGWVTLRTGPWTLQFAVHREGRFPRTDDLLRPTSSARSSCHWSAADGERLQRTLLLLPAADEVDGAVTLDLNGQVAIRARSAHITEPVEIQLADGRPSGEPMRIATNRLFLLKAAQLGLQALYLFGKDAPLLAADEHRTYLWMPLAAERIVPPIADAESQAARGAA
jgi:hypothetical protein